MPSWRLQETGGGVAAPEGPSELHAIEVNQEEKNQYAKKSEIAWRANSINVGRKKITASLSNFSKLDLLKVYLMLSKLRGKLEFFQSVDFEWLIFALHKRLRRVIKRFWFETMSYGMIY